MRSPASSLNGKTLTVPFAIVADADSVARGVGVGPGVLVGRGVAVGVASKSVTVAMMEGASGVAGNGDGGSKAATAVGTSACSVAITEGASGVGVLTAAEVATMYACTVSKTAGPSGVGDGGCVQATDAIAMIAAAADQISLNLAI